MCHSHGPSYFRHRPVEPVLQPPTPPLSLLLSLPVSTPYLFLGLSPTITSSCSLRRSGSFSLPRPVSMGRVGGPRRDDCFRGTPVDPFPGRVDRRVSWDSSSFPCEVTVPEGKDGSPGSRKRGSSFSECQLYLPVCLRMGHTGTPSNQGPSRVGSNLQDYSQGSARGYPRHSPGPRDFDFLR